MIGLGLSIPQVAVRGQNGPPAPPPTPNTWADATVWDDNATWSDNA